MVEDGAGPRTGTLCGDWRFQAGPRSLPPLTHFHCYTGQHDFHCASRAGSTPSGKTNKHGGSRSASVPTVLIWLSVSMVPQTLTRDSVLFSHVYLMFLFRQLLSAGLAKKLLGVKNIMVVHLQDS